MVKALLTSLGVWLTIWAGATVLTRYRVFKSLPLFTLVTLIATVASFMAGFGVWFNAFWND